MTTSTLQITMLTGVMATAGLRCTTNVRMWRRLEAGDGLAARQVDKESVIVPGER
jgi:hypothetical protein